jgi:F5/8 type C domain
MAAQDELVLWSAGAAGLEGWSASAAPGSRGSLAAERGPRGAALRFDFGLAGHGAWAIARREVALELPAHYVATLHLRGEADATELQLKLVDASGANVWWWRQRGFRPSPEGEGIAFRRASLEFAWGPRSGGDPDRLGAVELAVAGPDGARGRLLIEDLRIEPRPLPAGPPRAVAARASSFAPGFEPERALEPDRRTSWRPAPGDGAPWLELDLGARCEWGGLAVDFAGGGAAPPCRVLGSDDGARWETLAEDAGGPGPGRWLRTGAVETRFARLELRDPGPAGVTRAAAVPIELAVSPARFASSAARGAPRGRYPRHLLGENAYWAVVGAEGDSRKGLLGADGALEVDAEAFTLEPFLQLGGRTLGWADAALGASLAEGALPVPTVTWEVGDVRLRVTAFASGPAGRSALVARYAVENAAPAAAELRLALAIRPFQVTPAWQSLNLRPAVAPIERIDREGARIRVDGRSVAAVSAPDGFGAARSGGAVHALFEGSLPEAETARDPLGFADGVLAWDLRLAPGASETIAVAVPLHEETPAPPAGLSRGEAAAWCDACLREATDGWRARLAALPISLPPAAAPLEESLRASVAWILVNREGPRIQPGPRTYRRSWIRDGTLTGSALAEMGFADVAAAFLRWYAPHQLANGRVPCAVDRRGVDLTPEHDSHGELVWGAVEHARLTGDLALLRELWPRLLRAVDAIAALCAERTGPAFRGDPRFGLLPESISHEGYAGSPVHAYWDDFFAVRALGDAAEAAGWLGDAAAAARIGALRDALRRDLHASLAAAMARHGIDFLPGSVELGDFDPTSTAIALDPCGEMRRLDPAALARTFERYVAEFEARRRGERPYDAYTPYEVRSAVALLRLGWKERVHALLAWLVADQRPAAWRQWPEVATRDPRAPRFLGDLPHGWVASSFVRAVRRLLAYERDEDGELVLAAGVPEAWVSEPPGVRARGLPTHFGPLDLAIEADGPDGVRFRFGGACRPPGGVVLESPLERPLREASADGRPCAVEAGRRVRLGALPREAVLRAGPRGRP